jgi:lipoyl(octanoyl) transferase
MFIHWVKAAMKKICWHRVNFLKKLRLLSIKLTVEVISPTTGRGKLLAIQSSIWNIKIGVREYIEKMENAIIATIAEYGLTGGGKEGATGVWLDY